MRHRETARFLNRPLGIKQSFFKLRTAMDDLALRIHHKACSIKQNLILAGELIDEDQRSLTRSHARTRCFDTFIAGSLSEGRAVGHNQEVSASRA